MGEVLLAAAVAAPQLSSQAAEGVRLYESLYTIRRSEQAIIEEYHHDEMKTPMHMSMGQEAIPVGVCAALTAGDRVFGSYRSHALFLARTGDVERFFAELFGRVTGTAAGKAGSMHVAAPELGHMCSSAIVASCIPVAVGCAFANKYQRTGNVAAVFFGDGAVDEGVFWESLNTACAMELPVLFICEDNGLAVHTPVSARTGYSSLSSVVSQFRCHVVDEDTTDVERITTIGRHARDLAAQTSRPVFLRIRCYRYLEHVGIAEDFDAGYRSHAEFLEWQQRDSLALQEERLRQLGAAGDLDRVRRQVDARVAAAIAAARAAAEPAPDELLRGVFYENA